MQASSNGPGFSLPEFKMRLDDMAMDCEPGITGSLVANDGFVGERSGYTGTDGHSGRNRAPLARQPYQARALQAYWAPNGSFERCLSTVRNAECSKGNSRKCSLAISENP